MSRAIIGLKSGALLGTLVTGSVVFPRQKLEFDKQQASEVDHRVTVTIRHFVLENRCMFRHRRHMLVVGWVLLVYALSGACLVSGCAPAFR